RDIHKHNAQMKYSRIPLHKVSAAAPSKSQPVLTTAARTIRDVKPKFSKARPNITPYAVSKSKSPFRRPFIRHPFSKPSISPPRVNAANPSIVSTARVNAANPSAVSAAKVNAAKLFAVSVARINVVKPFAVTAVQHNHTKKGNPQQALKDKGVIDSGCFRHMTGNMSYLSNFEELNGGYVAFGGNPKGDAHADGKEHDDDIQKSMSPDIYSSRCGDQTKEQGDKTKNKDKGKSPVVTITGFRDLNEEFEDCINNSSNGVSAAGPSVSATDLNFTNITNDFSVAGPLNLAMPNLEDISHDADDVGAEADTNNKESIISTRSMARGVRDQGGISQMFNEDFHTCMFACFLSQEDPKRIHQALKDPSWVEAMQEELL
nr:ribonuclease H-like domain-containing protein [Tanacetum cinerariifolium]